MGVKVRGCVETAQFQPVKGTCDSSSSFFVLYSISRCQT